jgi:Uncharacterized protein with a C-terminal OMP (outer membrane protein) domain
MMQTSSFENHVIPAVRTTLPAGIFLIFCLVLLASAPLEAVEISLDGRILTGAGDGGGNHPNASGGTGGKGGIGGGGGGGGAWNGNGTGGKGGDGGVGGGGGAYGESNGGRGGDISTNATTENSDAGPGYGFGAGGAGGTSTILGGSDGGYGVGMGGPGMSGISGGGGGYGSNVGGTGGSASVQVAGNNVGGGGGGGGAGRVLTAISTFTVSSEITGGRGGDTSVSSVTNGSSGGGGGGGVGLVVHDEATVTSTSRIVGGAGGDTNPGGSSADAGYAGQGGAGVFMVGASLSHTEVGQHAGGIFNNQKEVSGGNGGKSVNGFAGSGGHGVLANNAVINNFENATISGGNAGSDGGAGSNGGHGIYAHSYSTFATKITNSGSITGGNGTGTGGLGGYGILLTGNDGKIYNNSTVNGGTNGDGTRRAAIKIGNNGIASVGNEVHITSVSLFGGDVDASEATNSKLVLGGDGNGTFNLARLVATNTAADNDFINFTRLGKEGTSVWTLEGVASGSQSWSISAGKLIGSTDTVKGNAKVEPGATLEFNQSTSDTYAALLSGSGTLVKSGGGALTLSKPSIDFAGKTVIDAGTVRMRDPFALGSGAIVNNSELALSFSGSFSNALTGAGDVNIDAASNTVAFTTAKAYTGSTRVIAGLLKLDAINALADSSGLEIEANAGIAATFDQTIRNFKLNENALASFGNKSLALEEGNISGYLADVANLDKISGKTLELKTDVRITGNLTHQAGEITIAEGKTLAIGGAADFAAGTTLNVHPGAAAALSADTISFAGMGPVIDLIGYSSSNSCVVAEAANGAIGANYQVKIGGSPVGTGLDLRTFALPNLARQNNDRQLVATTALVWNSSSPASAHGVFDIPGQYTIDSVLADHDNPAAMYSEGSYAWDGKSLVKRGTGILTLGQHNTYTGLTTIEAGTLRLGVSPTQEGGIASGGVMVRSGGNLEGSGRVGGTVRVESGGSLLAGDGDSGGILSVKELEMASGSKYTVSRAGTVHVDGNAHIDDNVGFTLHSDDLRLDLPRTLLNAGSISGLSQDKEVELAFLTYILKQNEYGGRVSLDLEVEEVLKLITAAGTANQIGVAGALDAWNGGDNPLGAEILLLASQSEARQAFELLDNSLSTTTSSHILSLNQGFWHHLSGSARAVRVHALPEITTQNAYASLSPGFRPSRDLFTWVQAGGTLMRSPYDANTARGKVKGYDFAVGLEGGSEQFRLGLVFRRADSRLEVDSRLSRSDIDSYNLGVYAMTGIAKGPGQLKLSLGFAGGLHDLDNRREVAFGGYFDCPTSHYQSKSVQGILEAGYALGPSAESSIEPYANLTVNALWDPAVTESGGFAATHADGGRQCNLAATFGGRFSHNLAAWASLDLDLGYRRTFGNLTPSGRMYFANDPAQNSFTTIGSRLTADEAVIGATLRLMPTEYLEFSLGCQAAFGKRSTYQRGTFSVGLLF